MPYEYRKLTPEEIESILHERKERGYPLHAPPHPFRSPGYYQINAANYEHAPIMADLGRRTAFESRLIETMHEIDAEIAGWVVLPNHYHILLGVTAFNLIPQAVKKLHNGTSYEWNRMDGCSGKRRVWYKYTDRFIRNQAHYYQSLNYIHINPKKHGYVNDPYEWPWSSLSIYLEDKGREWLREQWVKFPPPADGEGWDE